MNDYAGLLLAQEDFSSFSKSNTQVFTKRCVVTHAAWEVRDDRSVFTIRANRFLRNMVRAVVGTLLLAGERKINADDFKAILEGKDEKVSRHLHAGMRLVSYPGGIPIYRAVVMFSAIPLK